MKKKVSVFIPCYNVAAYVGDMLDSVLCQTMKEFDIVLVDDGSSDDTLVILREYEKKDERIKIYTNKENMGLPYTRNLMFKYCDSDYIALMDADDLMPVYRLKEEMDYLDSNPSVSAVGGAMQIIDEKGKFTDRIAFLPNKYEECKAAMMMADCFPNGSMMIRKKDVVDAGIKYDSRFHCMQDYRFWSEMILKCRMENLNHIMLYYRENQSSVTARSHNDSKRRELYDIIHREYIEGLFPNMLGKKEMDDYLALSRVTSAGKQPVKRCGRIIYSLKMQVMLNKFKVYYGGKDKNDLFASQIEKIISRYTSRKVYSLVKPYIRLALH